MKRSVVLVLGTLIFVACGGQSGSSPTPNTDSSPATAAPTTAPPTTQPPTPTTTTLPPTTTTTLPLFSGEVVVYRSTSNGQSSFRQGPFVQPVAFEVTTVEDDIEVIALNTLFAITGDATSIPAGVTVDDFSLDGTIAVVDLSEQFASGAGSASVLMSLAQLTYTLTRFDHIDSVLLIEDGEPVTVFSAEGIVLDGPMVRDDFEDQTPGILLDYPAVNQKISTPFTGYGNAVVPGGKFYVLVNSLPNVEVLAEDDVQTDNSTGRGYFEFTVEAGIEGSTGTLVTVWAVSADGMLMHSSQIEVKVSTD